METAGWIIKFLVFVLGIQYLIGPIIVWCTQKLPEKYVFRLVDSKKFLSERTPTFIALHEEIQDKEFEYIDSSELNMSNTSVCFSIYNHFDKKIVCTLVTARSDSINTTYIEFTQLYKNGSVLNVSNSSIINIYPTSEMRLSFRFPQVNDFDKLLTYAEKLINSNKQNEQRITFEKGKEFETVESYLNIELNELIERGWVQSKVVTGNRRLTIKGALLMTWKSVWPVKQILNRSDIAYSKRAIENA
ncbi:MAG: hypothetical protein K8S15_00915 [Candidatus Aegiribacteria sp.]|nr:hypothetical protein [Candidatus Aegiribacteria sp.]